MTLEQINAAGDKWNPICEVCGAKKTVSLPLGGFLCGESHHKQRMEYYAQQAQARGDYRLAAELRRYGDR